MVWGTHQPLDNSETLSSAEEQSEPLWRGSINRTTYPTTHTLASHHAPSSLLLDDVASLFLETALAVAPLLNQSKISSPVRSFFWRHFPQRLLPMTAYPIWLRNR
jgi:hypothetical protein